MKKGYIVYIILVALLCLVPSLCMIMTGPSELSDSESAPSPSFFDNDGSPNINFLSDAGIYFDSHFAFRDVYVTAASKLTTTLFGVSSSEGVVEGKDGWLYYQDSIDDYLGKNLLTDRQLSTIARSLRIAQDNVQQSGAEFVFTVAPNKNTLYGEHMQSYYPAADRASSNLSRFKTFLEEQGVNYVDLQELFEEKEDTLYHSRDSHWNNVGAAMVADALLVSLGVNHPDYSERDYEVRDDFIGDLDKMISPAAPTTEDEIYYQPSPDFEYKQAYESNFDPKITTYSIQQGSLLMYRDSFGNSLLPFMAECFGKAYFSRGVPYRLFVDLPACEASAVCIERAERFLPDMATSAPSVPAPLVTYGTLNGVEPVKGVEIEADNVSDGYIRLSGVVPQEKIETNSCVYLSIDGFVEYEACCYTDEESGEERFEALVPASNIEENSTFSLYIAVPNPETDNQTIYPYGSEEDGETESELAAEVGAEGITCYAMTNLTVRNIPNDEGDVVSLVKAGEAIEIAKVGSVWSKLTQEKNYVLTEFLTKDVEKAKKAKHKASDSSKVGSEKNGEGNEENASGKVEVSRENFDDCDGSGHGYTEITYSDGSTEIVEY